MPCAATRSVASFAFPEMEIENDGARNGGRWRSYACMGEAADQAIEACGGDARATVIALLIMNNAMERELELTRVAVSSGFSRQWHHRKPASRNDDGSS